MNAVLLSAASVSLADKDARTEAAESTGPFLRVTVIRAGAGQTADPATDGIVFRIGLSHPYRLGGSHPPVAAGHLSRAFTRAPDPPQAPPVTAVAEQQPVKQLDLPVLPGELPVLPGAEKRLKAAESRAERKRHTEAAGAPAESAVRLNFFDNGATWRDVAACQPVHRLAIEERSTLLDLQPFLPPPQPESTVRTQPAPDYAAIVYVRAFAGPQLQAVRVPLRLELLAARGADQPVASIEIVSGFFGCRLSDPRGEHPRFDSEESQRRHWHEHTETILASRSGREFFCGPDAPRYGKGTREDPAALEILLRSSVIRPGDTIWLLEGTYPAPAHVHTAPPPEIVDKPKPVKQPKLDDIGTLVRDPGEPSLDDLLGSRSGSQKPKTVTRHYFMSSVKGHTNNPVIVRNWPGHRVHLEGGLKIRGAHTWFWGFEVGESPERANSRETATRIEVNSPGCRLINLEFHGHREGPVIMSRSVCDSEIYGCLVHDIGYWPKTRPGSEGFSPGVALGVFNSGGVFRITDNIVFDNYGVGITFPMGDEHSHNFVLDGNVVFASGSKGKYPAWSTPNVQMNWHVPVWRVFLTDNVFHHPAGARVNLVSVAYSPLLGWDSGEVVMRNNIFDGGRTGLDIGAWSHFHVTGNTIRASESLVRMNPKRLPADGSTWNRNLLVSPTSTSTREKKLLGLWGGPLDFDQWQTKMRFDTQGEHVIGTQLPSPRIVVRPNLYEPQRVHVAVVGWNQQDSVKVDLSDVFEQGQEFSVFNVRDLRSALFTSRFSGEPVSFPRGNSKLSPLCDAFVVIGVNPKQAQVPSANRRERAPESRRTRL